MDRGEKRMHTYEISTTASGDLRLYETDTCEKNSRRDTGLCKDEIIMLGRVINKGVRESIEEMAVYYKDTNGERINALAKDIETHREQIWNISKELRKIHGILDSFGTEIGSLGHLRYRNERQH
jgi:hypothetical protein